MAKKIKCPTCETVLEDEELFCPYCGEDISDL
jgi:RNA polymerase subunit RPABC4/transcription elongation factor Spt4